MLILLLCINIYNMIYYYMFDWQIFSPSPWLVFSFSLVSLEEQKISVFMKSNLSIFFLLMDPVFSVLRCGVQN